MTEKSTETFRAQSAQDDDPRRDRDPSEPLQPPPVDDPEMPIQDEPVEDPPDAPPVGEPERRDPGTGEPAWRDPGAGPGMQV